MLNYTRSSDDKHEICLVENPYDTEKEKPQPIDIGPILEMLDYGFDSDFKYLSSRLDDFIQFLMLDITYEDINTNVFNSFKDNMHILFMLRDSFDRVGKGVSEEYDRIEWLEKRMVMKTVTKLYKEMTPKGGSFLDSIKEIEQFVATKIEENKQLTANA